MTDLHSPAQAPALSDEAVARVIELSPERLYAFTHPVARPEACSAGAAYSSVNCYLATEPDHAVLIDAGYTAHEQMLCEQIASVLDPQSALTIWALRIGEFSSICNIRPIAERFEVDRLYGVQGVPPMWADFRPEFVPYGSAVGGGALARLDGIVARPGDRVSIGGGERSLLAVDAPLRLLLTNWVYDEATRTLFTSDAFSYISRPSAGGPWLTTGVDDETSGEEIWRSLLEGRFWWLAGARTDDLRRRLVEIFERYEIDTIAPAFGSVIHGRATVERHVTLLDEVLRDASRTPSVGLCADRWTL